MKLKGVIMSVFAMMMVTLCGLHLLSCGDKEDDGFRNNNNGGGSTNVPQELLGAWQESNAQGSSVKNIYVFNADGTGKIYIGWDYTDNKAREVQSFVYSYNSQNSTLVFSGRSYTLAFKYGNTQMDWLIGYNDVFLSFYRHEGNLPTVGGGGYNGGGNNGGNNDGGNGGNNDGGNGGNNDGGNVPSAPTGLSATQSGPKAYPYIYLSWNYNPQADHYVIYRSTSLYGSYSKIGTNIASSYSDEKNISNGKTYYYKVTAANSNNMESGYSNIASVTVNTTITETPGIASCSVTKGTNQITIKWTYASGSGYSAPDEVRLSTSTYKTIFTWTSASSKKSHTVKTTDLTTSYGDLAYENTLYLEVKNSAGSGKGAKIMWNWKTNTGYIMGDLCGYTTF